MQYPLLVWGIKVPALCPIVGPFFLAAFSPQKLTLQSVRVVGSAPATNKGRAVQSAEVHGPGHHAPDRAASAAQRPSARHSHRLTRLSSRACDYERKVCGGLLYITYPKPMISFGFLLESRRCMQPNDNGSRAAGCFLWRHSVKASSCGSFPAHVCSNSAQLFFYFLQLGRHIVHTAAVFWNVFKTVTICSVVHAACRSAGTIK